MSKSFRDAHKIDDLKQGKGRDLAELYDDTWKRFIEHGRGQAGDLNLTLEFLDRVQVLKPEMRILELGSATGILTKELLERGYTDLVGTDIAISALKAGREELGFPRTFCGDAAALPLPADEFHAVISFDLAEHIPDITEHFREVHRVLKDGGVYAFQTPNIITNSIRATYRWRGFGWKKFHCSLQFAGGLQKKLRAAGFQDVRFTKIPPFSEHKISQIPGWARWIFLNIPWRKLPVRMQTNFYVVATK
jgi:SAM-dependent methyltransferase